MYEFLTQNQFYIVLIITLLIWLGIIGYLIRLDTRITKAEEKLKQ